VELHHPRSLDAAYQCLTSGATPLGGGTLLLPAWQRDGYPERAFSLREVPEATTLGEGRLGAAVTLDRLVAVTTRALSQAAAALGTAPLRAQATVAGNLAGSGPRCLLPVLLALGARANVLTDQGLAQDSLSQALALGRTLVSLEWQEPQFSSYRKVRNGRSGLPSLAIATALHTGPGQSAHVHIAVWRDRKVFCEAFHTRGGIEQVLQDLRKTPLADFSPRDTDIIQAQIAEALAQEAP